MVRGSRPAAAGAVAPLVVEHDPVTGLDQAAGDRDPDGVGAAPAVGEDHRRTFADIPHGQVGAVRRGQADRTGRLQRAPAELTGDRTEGSVPGGGGARAEVAGPRGGHLPVGDGAPHERGGGAERQEAATAAGEVEGRHSGATAQAGHELLEGDGREAMGVPAEHRFESHRHHGPVGRDGLDDGGPHLLRWVGVGEALDQPCAAVEGPPCRR